MVHAYREPGVIAPEEIAALSSIVTSESIASGSSSTFVDCCLSMLISLPMLRKDQGQDVVSIIRTEDVIQVYLLC